MRKGTISTPGEWDVTEYRDLPVVALPDADELRRLRHDAACWQRLRDEMAFYATGPLPNESAIVQRHMTLAEEHVKRQETAT